MLRAPKILKKLIASSTGFTLLEVAVALGIMSLAVGMVGTAIFQTQSIQRYWQDDAIATKDLRHSGSWLARDVLNAETTNLVDGNPPVNTVTVNWTDSASVSHTAIYSLSGTTLMRNFDGVQNVLADRVVSVGFSLSSKVLTFSLEVQSSRGGTETINLQTYLRELS